MKKILVILITLLFLAGSSLGSEEMEQEFIERFEEFIAAKDLNFRKLQEIWIPGDAPVMEFNSTQQDLQITMLSGIKEIQFIDIFPVIQKGIDEGIEIEGERYKVNLPPYKMLSIEYKKEIEGGSGGWSMVVGEKRRKTVPRGTREIGRRIKGKCDFHSAIVPQFSCLWWRVALLRVQQLRL